VHKQWSFIYMGFNQDDLPHPANMFFCAICRESSWRRLSGSSGNIKKHIKGRHPRVIQEEAALAMARERPRIPVERLLGLLLENNLSFRFAESPRLRSLFSHVPGRNGLAQAAARGVDARSCVR
jgi:hypothetical protein